MSIHFASLSEAGSSKDFGASSKSRDMHKYNSVYTSELRKYIIFYNFSAESIGVLSAGATCFVQWS